MKKLFLFSILLSSISLVFSQRTIESSADILQEIKKLNVLTNVLYVAAHPDDENTRLIAWLENEKLARTAYLSLTRGDGGQNLVGSEKGDAMGVLRTQELLEARKIDGAEQFFSRANDFGYSKTAEETLEFWDKEKILADVVWTIRKFKPDVIITRFPPDSRGGHGHHTASAMLAEEAFKLAADKNSFPTQFRKTYQEIEELKGSVEKACFVCEPWQSKRILWNTSVWWDKQLPEKAAKADDYIKIDIGDYNELLGLSYSEIASDSRSQHKSQGFGSARNRGSKLEYLKHSDGEKANSDLFEGINTTWSRVAGSENIQKSLNEILKSYDFNNPAASVKSLVSLYQLMKQKKDNFYVKEKMKDLRRVIKVAAGIHVEALADNYNYPAFQETPVKGKFNIINRSNSKINLKAVYPTVDSSFTNISLTNNVVLSLPFEHLINIDPSDPYWLIEPLPAAAKKQLNQLEFKGDFTEESKNHMLEAMKSDEFITYHTQQYGMPENIAKVTFRYLLEIEGVEIYFNEDIDYKWTDRVDGELHRNVIVSPEVTATPTQKVYIISDQSVQEVNVLLEANKANIKSSINLIAPPGWTAQPSSIDFELENVGSQKSVSFNLFPPRKPSVGEISFSIGEGKAKSVQRIDYPHIKPQIMFPWATAKVVKMKLTKKVRKIGYINGSGDEVAENLRQVGFDVTSLNAEELPLTHLGDFETIIVGIRAYNTEKSMKNGNSILNEYVKKGGNVIVQYNTSRGIKSGEIGPYPFKLSRKRVTNEDAKPTFLKPEHTLLNSPDKLSMSDFDGWVQERGLYFADEWDSKYETIIAWNDPGEEPQQGSILVCDYGDGHFIFTGISFFRELPAGVPGAYRLLNNMISYGK